MDKQIKKLTRLIQTYLSHDRQADEGDNQTIEHLHKIRVTARKLVSVSPPESDQLQLFKKVIQASNSLRDIDVFRAELLPSFPEKWQSKMAPLYQGIAEFREQLDVKFKLLLETEILADIEALLVSLAAIDGKRSTISVNADKHKLELNEIEKQLQKQIKVIQKIDIEDKHLHKARLKIKRLRYQLEHFHSKEKKALELCVYLQDELGHFHDLCQGIKLLKKHAELMSDMQLNKYVKHLEKNKESLLQSIRSKLHKKYKLKKLF